MPVIQQIKVPLVAVNDTSLTVVSTPFTQGDPVKKGDIVLVFETSKTTYDAIAETDGFIEYLCELDMDYDVNETVANIYDNKSEVAAVFLPKERKATAHFYNQDLFTEATGTWDGETLFSPAAIKLMQANDISTELFKGSDFVSRTDVEKKLGNSKGSGSKMPVMPHNASAQLPIDMEKVTVEKLSSNKKREIGYLSAVQSPGLTSTINTMVDTDGIFVHLNHSLQYLKNSLLPVIIYETARLLQIHSSLNAYFTGDAIAYYKEVNIGFAIDVDKGLKVLRVKDATGKAVKNIEQDIMQLSGKYLDDALSIEDLTDISFTITDLSSEGVAFFTPLVNMMNSAILGVSSIDEKLQRCVLSITFDHRVTEGKVAARFLHELKERLESYRSKNFPGLHQNISCFKCFKKLNEDLSDVGFTKCITPKGDEAYICQSCLKGF